MIAKNTPKSAVDSTPAAAPAGSPPASDLGAIAEENVPFDIMGALNADERSDRSTVAEVEAKTDEEAAPAATETATDETPASEATEETAPTGEVAATEEASETETKPNEDGAETETDSKSEEAEATKSGTQKRFDELTAARRTAEEQLAKANERTAFLEAAAAGKLSAQPLAHIDSIDALEAERNAVIHQHQWAITHPDGGEYADAAGKVTPYDADGVRSLQAKTFEAIYKHVPAREQFLRERATMDAKAVDAYPWLKDTRNGAGAQVQGVIEAKPALRLLGPEYRLIAADALVGQQLRSAGITVDAKLIDRLKTEAGKPASGAQRPTVGTQPVVRKTPPAAPRTPGVVPARVQPREAQSRAASKQLSKGDGNVKDLASAIAARL